MATKYTDLRSVNGSWFCPVCFISCSTKGNLTRHMRQLHTNHSLGENLEGNSEKFILLGCDNSNEEPAEFC